MSLQLVTYRVRQGIQKCSTKSSGLADEIGLLHSNLSKNGPPLF